MNNRLDIEILLTDGYTNSILEIDREKFKVSGMTSYHLNNEQLENIAEHFEYDSVWELLETQDGAILSDKQIYLGYLNEF